MFSYVQFDQRLPVAAMKKVPHMLLSCTVSIAARWSRGTLPLLMAGWVSLSAAEAAPGGATANVPTDLAAQIVQDRSAPQGVPVSQEATSVVTLAPAVQPPPTVADLVTQPTASSLERVRILGQRLRPVAVPSPTEVAEFADFLRAQPPQGPSLEALGEYVARYPRSPWTPALANLLAEQWRSRGYFVRAADIWKSLWQAWGTSDVPLAKTYADAALADYACHLAWASDRDALRYLVLQAGGRDLRGTAASRWTNALSALDQMISAPAKTFACGPGALHQLGVGVELEDLVTRCPATERGTSLLQLQQLSQESPVPMRAARRAPGSKLVLPAVAHWRVGHYSALKSRNSLGQVRALDTSFALFGQAAIDMEVSAVEEESSGAFLVPVTTTLPSGWMWMTSQEADAVWGRCGPSSRDPDGDDPDAPQVPAPKGRGCGMPVYSFYTATLALSVSDTPLFYTVPKGPAVDFTLDYNSQTSTQPTIFPFSNLGPKWTFNWLSFAVVKSNPGAGGLVSVDVYKARGGYDRYTDVPVVSEGTASDGTSWSAVNPRSLAQMAVVKRANDTYYLKRHMPQDGTIRIYDLPDGLSYPLRFMMTKIIDRHGNQVQIGYDGEFRVTSVTDALGQVSTFQYTASDPLLITGITDPFGRTAVFGYDALGRLTSLTDQVGMTSTIAYLDASDQIAGFTTPYGATSFTYGKSNNGGYYGMERWIEAKDPLGDRERMEYRSYLSSSTTPATAAIPEEAADVPQGMNITNSGWNYYNTYYWDKKAMRMAPGDYTQATQYRFCRNGSSVMSLVEAVKKPLQNRVWFQYPGQTATGTMSGVTIPKPCLVGTVLDDGTTQLTQATYNGLGMPLTLVDPQGRTTWITYDATGLLPVTVKQGPSASASIVAQYAYDSRGRMLSVTDASGQRTEFTYNLDGKPLTITRPLRAGQTAETVTMTYDAKGRLETVSDPAGLAQRLTYDLQSRVKTVTDRDGYVLTYDYDAFDRVIKVSFPDATFAQFVYNRLNREWSRDREGRWTREWYNALGKRIAVGDPLGRVTAFEWCRCGALQKLWDPMGRMTSWNYDVQGRLTAKVMPDGTSTAYAYQPKSGRLASVTDALGQVKQFTYFADDRLASVAYTNAVVATPGVSFQYDPYFPRLSSMTDGVGITSYAYAAIPTTATLTPGTGAGQLSAVDGPFANDTLTYAYDEWSRPVGRTLSGVTSSVQLDRLDRVTTVANGLGTFSNAFVGNTGRPASTTLPTTPATTISYGFTSTAQDLRLQSITAAQGTTAISTHTYGYSATGRITSWSQKAGTATPQVWDFGYDAADQLTRATRTTGGTLTSGLGYTYDTAGNRTSIQVQTPTGTVVGKTDYNALNQITTTNAGGGTVRIEGFLDEPGSVTVDGKPAAVDGQNRFGIEMPATVGSNTYAIQATDAKGNSRTSQYRIDVTSPGTPRSFTYDLNGNCTSDGQRQFTWDAENRLVRIVQGVTRTDFVYDGFSRRVKTLEYLNGVLQSESRFVWDGSKIVEERSSSDVVAIRYYPQGQVNGTEKRFYLRDHLGSVREVLDAGGVVRARYDYDLYGNRTKVTGAWDVAPGFTGHYHHQTSGLILTWFRAYDPVIGRWLSRDPIGEGGGANLYAYVKNQTVIKYDPLGLEEVVTPPPPKNTNPLSGEPNTEKTSYDKDGNPKGTRKYGDNGFPEYDIDYDHDHGQGQPHIHPWNIPPPGVKPTHEDRLPGVPYPTPIPPPWWQRIPSPLWLIWPYDTMDDYDRQREQSRSCPNNHA